MSNAKATEKEPEPKLPEGLSKLIDVVKHDIAQVEIAIDAFTLGGFMVDFTWRDRWTVVEWQPTQPNSYGVSLVTEDTVPFTGPDEIIEGAQDAARRVSALLRGAPPTGPNHAA
jgi:hypothetical protein